MGDALSIKLRQPLFSYLYKKYLPTMTTTVAIHYEVSIKLYLAPCICKVFATTMFDTISMRVLDSLKNRILVLHVTIIMQENIYVFHCLNSNTILYIANCKRAHRAADLFLLTVMKTTPQHPDARRVQRTLNKMARMIVHGFDTRVRLFSV